MPNIELVRVSYFPNYRLNLRTNYPTSEVGIEDFFAASDSAAKETAQRFVNSRVTAVKLFKFDYSGEVKNHMILIAQFASSYADERLVRELTTGVIEHHSDDIV